MGSQPCGPRGWSKSRTGVPGEDPWAEFECAATRCANAPGHLLSRVGVEKAELLRDPNLSGRKQPRPKERRQLPHCHRGRRAPQLLSRALSTVRGRELHRLASPPHTQTDVCVEWGQLVLRSWSAGPFSRWEN